MKKLLVLTAVLMTACGEKPAPVVETPVKIAKKPFGTADGQALDLYTLRNKNRMEVAITNYGGTVVSLKAPDRKGQMADIVLGFDSIEGYLKPEPYFGALIGRYGNRIAKGRFKLNGTEYVLAKNDGENHLHGGVRGFDKKVWTAKETPAGGLELEYTSKDL